MRIGALILIASLSCLTYLGVCCLAGTIQGTAFDPDGRVVPDARVLLMTDYVKQQEQQTGPTGGFRFEGLKAGRYEVQIKKGRMFIFQNTVILEKPDQDIVIYAVLPIARMVDVSGVSARRPAGAPKFVPAIPTYQTGGQVELAEPTERIRTPYPAEAVSQGIEGEVALHARINIDGSVSDAIVLSSPHELLAKAALEAVSKARYRPMKLNGHPVACGIDIRIAFTLTAGT